MPVSSGLRMPSPCRKPFPRPAVTCVEVAEMPSTWFNTTIGSPWMLALGTAGSVGSHPPSHLRGPAGGAAAPGAPGSHRSPDGGRATGAVVPGDVPADVPADHCRPAAAWATSSLDCASSRSAANRVTCSRCSSNLPLELVSAATAASSLPFASAAALSAFCLSSRAADSLFTCSVRARCKLAMTASELAVSVLAAVSVAMMSSGLVAVR